MRTMKKHERPEKPKWEFKLDENGKPIWPKRPEMTPERLAAVKYLDELRSASPENAPEVPLSAIVYVQVEGRVTGVTNKIDIGLANWTLASSVDKLIPSNILEPFTTISPIPMIVVALLIVAALATIGKSFGSVKSAIDACYDLFSSIIKIVMDAFPVACFLLFLDPSAR